MDSDDDSSDGGVVVLRRQDSATSHSYRGISIGDRAQVHLGDQYIYSAIEPDPVAALRKRVMTNLAFPELWQRYSAIEEPCHETYQWVTDGNGPAGVEEPAWDSYLEWQQNDTQAVYWITGKPGSGKSTLMKHLYMAFRRSGGSKETLSFSMWFWEAGSNLQKSLEGCMRSLLWQIADCTEDESTMSHLLPLAEMTLWSTTSMQQALKRSLLSLVRNGSSVSLFLDGVDECGEEAEPVLDLIRNLALNVPNVKICISSRPEQLFIDELGDFPKLRLHDLNKPDIETTIEEEFVKKQKVSRLLENDYWGGRELCQLLYENAKGVFLWVRLAIKTLLVGITNRDTVSDLIDRLNELPTDLDGLYLKMLSRSYGSNGRYRKLAGLFFSLAIHRSFSAVGLYLASNHSCRKSLLDVANNAHQKSIPSVRWDEFLARVNTVSAGLLDVQGEASNSHYAMPPLHAIPESWRKYVMTKIGFIHRTARTYICETLAGCDLISECGLDEEAIEEICFETRLALYIVVPWLTQGIVHLIIPDTLYSSNWFGCSCSDPSEISYKKAVELLQSLNEMRALHTDYYYLPGSQKWNPTCSLVCVSHLDGSLDLARTCARFRWYRRSSDELSNASKHATDKLWLTLVLNELFNPSLLLGISIENEINTGLRRSMKSLIARLRSLGADLSLAMPSPCGDKNTFQNLLYTGLSGEAREEATRLAPMVFQDDMGEQLSTRIVSSITNMALMHPLQGAYLLGGESNFYLFGDFETSEVVKMLREDYSESDAPLDSRLGRVFVVVCSVTSSTDHSGIISETICSSARPTSASWYGISERDSQAIISLLTAERETHLSRANVWMWDTHIRVNWSLQPGIVEDESAHILTICERSVHLDSVLDALNFMGKPKEGIERFVTFQEKRMRDLHLSEKLIADFLSTFRKS